ncbi:SDR family NAD(P)-dependent oxidoreductase [Mycolicibacterium thermoresistibile]|uniref:3-oxoacyl-[acyl-carrier-protein] reductase MabA n=2 Tax=Mycolicibacterium thermoresistibile TaxID=1797 RepID=G7CEQ3_MYCT3|nr:SDR family oxidoreductase [Mycolicibacterium thermoresistibile]EHI13545.1 short-chain dehydrogenase/reductase SDR [Mycolicibacterium thermoresistibile ATCC 19527]MCV7190387.1 SDR family oxidoreductase [Mycolicibacterium thermoresistibile]GAT15839.1 short-chain dehydrogenase/reductase SDR [Mycolicibacterium thermoresistibile]SNW19502.1 short-chain dehydrogenase/reductase SDR [Mycolicibacterium thermoresistibile]
MTKPRNALVTGGTDGIGKAIALRLRADGMRVAVTGRNAERGAQLVDEVGCPEEFVFIRSDATDPHDAERVAAEVRNALGGIGVLVNNVGGGSSNEFGYIHDLDPDAWLDSFNRNVMSAIRMTRAVVPDMLAASWGRIVMMSSLEGKMPTLPKIGPYVTSKHALLGLTKSLAFDYGAHGITCNAVCPGYVHIPTRQRKASKAFDEGRFADPQQNYKDLSRIGRHIELDEVAHAVSMLVAEESSAITGTTLNIDGGSSPY